MYARYTGGRPGGRAAEIWTATEERESEESPSEAVSSEEPTKRDDQGAPVTASANRPERGLSDLCIRQLAEWYAEASYRDYSPAAIAAGARRVGIPRLPERERPPLRGSVRQVDAGLSCVSIRDVNGLFRLWMLG
jgi:hypothetical protein